MLPTICHPTRAKFCIIDVQSELLMVEKGAADPSEGSSHYIDRFIQQLQERYRAFPATAMICTQSGSP
jgi:hypothetical protein